MQESVLDWLRHGYFPMKVEVGSEVESIQMSEDIDKISNEIIHSSPFIVGMLQMTICYWIICLDFHSLHKTKVLVIELTRLSFILEQYPLRIEGTKRHKDQHLFRFHLDRVPQLMYFQRRHC